MEVDSAVRLLNDVVYKPGWHITAIDGTDRFEGAVSVKIEYPAHNFNRDQAPTGYQEELVTYASFRIIAGDCVDAIALYRCLLDLILRIELHEAREALRVHPTFWAPFHPHKIEGMKRYGDVAGDLNFGIV